jgi:Protein of unknown function (DUF2933)
MFVDHYDHSGEVRSGILRSRAFWVAAGFFVIAGALLFTEHRAHVLGLLIYLPLLACPLMHFFMHGHHGHGSHGHADRPSRDQGSIRS